MIHRKVCPNALHYATAEPDRLLNFDDTLDTGGEWDEGGGVSTRWE